jgi:hypothetical protein
MQSDHGGEFDNELHRQVQNIHNTVYRFSVPHNPRCNGTVEHLGGEAKLLLEKILDHHSDKEQWSYFVEYVQYCLNSRVRQAHNGPILR